MHFNIYIDDQLGTQLTKIAKKTGKTRNSLVREAVQDWVKKHIKPGWPAAVLDFKGITDFTPFEEYRKDFSSDSEDPFA